MMNLQGMGNLNDEMLVAWLVYIAFEILEGEC